ncbi:MAG: aminopeptidase P family protein [Gemmatimonadota bacterium]|nr:MAG: aminopeptidase P family protein [Gemmatimonadota bacterium]
MKRAPLASAALLMIVTAASAQERPLGTLREQAAIQQGWLQLRLERVLPRLMRDHGVDMWIIPMREYNEDPIFRALVSPNTFAARRRTIYIFCDRGPEEGVERIAIGGSSQGGLYRVVTYPDAVLGAAAGEERRAEPFGPDQWQLLPPIVEACDPETIGVNISHTFAFSDGLSAGEWEQMRAALPEKYRQRVVHRERLALEYIAERLPEMLPVYVEMMKIAHEIIATAFSSDVITPGVTHTQDVRWWMRQRLNDLGLDTWFHASVDVQRQGVQMGDSANPVILHGDVLHCDIGVTALGLNTDTQHMGYVLRPGEADAPEGLKQALAVGNQLQDIVMEELEPGRAGNEVLRRALARMRDAGINGTVYSHPVGDHGHGAGPLVGLWDRQEGVPGRGDVPVRPNTWYSIELQATTPVAEWGDQAVRMALEEDAYLDEGGDRHWVLGRQERFHLVR